MFNDTDVLAAIEMLLEEIAIIFCRRVESSRL
jgi:hypothetical protein